MNAEQERAAGGHALTDLISAMRERKGSFTSREQRVADFVAANLEATTAMTIAELAAACDVSKPTVIRFCRSLACDGFRDFKLRLAQNLAVSQLYLHRSVDASQVTTEAAIDRVMTALISTVNTARGQIDSAAFQALRDVLVTSRQIVFAGVGGSSATVAGESANRFFRLGFPSYAVSDSLQLQMRAATLGPGDTLFAISASGETAGIVNAIAIAREYGANTACISRPGSSLGAEAEHAILLDRHVAGRGREHELAVVQHLQARLAGPQGRDDRLMPGQDPEFAGHARRHDHPRLTREHRALRGQQVHRHALAIG